MSLFVADITCREAVEFVTEYLEGSLSRRERRQFERHLKACDGCAGYLDEVRTVQKLTGQVGPENLDATTLDGLVAMFREFRSEQ